MRRIFQQAQGVFADVGKEAEQWELLVPLLEAIVKAGENCSAVEDDSKMSSSIRSDGKRSGQTVLKTEHDSLGSETAMTAEPTHPRLEHYGSPPWKHPAWDSCRLFFASPYFQRVWILQEFALSKGLTFLYGHLKIPANLFGNFLYYLTRYGNDTLGTYLSHSNSIDELRRLGRSGIDGLVNFQNMHLQRQLVMDRIPETDMRSCLIMKLAASRGFLATDPRDKVYALLGIASDGVTFASHINYSQPPKVIFHTFAQLFIEHGHGIELLYQAGPNRRSDRLPSWTPVRLILTPLSVPSKENQATYLLTQVYRTGQVH